MAKLEDAETKLNLAKKSFEERDYASCIENARLCIEISLKSLLDEFKISYVEKKRDKEIFYHDVSNKLKELFEKIEKYCEKDYEKNDLKIKLVRGGIILKCLTAIKDFCIYGHRDLGIPAKEIFDFHFEEFAKRIKDIADETYWLSWNLLYKIKE